MMIDLSLISLILDLGIDLDGLCVIDTLTSSFFFLIKESLHDFSVLKKLKIFILFLFSTFSISS